MFFVTFLRRELWRRRRQAAVIALGVALGIGLVITVTAAASGVRTAQGSVLKSLYGVGTGVTVTTQPGVASQSSGVRLGVGPGGSQVCTGGSCHNGATKIDNLTSSAYGPLADSEVTSVAKLPGVTNAVGGLTLNDTQITIPNEFGAGGGLPTPHFLSVDGTDLSHPALGPLSVGKITHGRDLTRADAASNVAVVDSNYATAQKLKVGKKITIAKTSFTIVGIVAQPQSGSPPDAFIPLGRAQALGKTNQDKSLAGQVNTIYVAAASAAVIPKVQKEISALLPKATVTSSSSLASQVTGSLSSTAKLANDLGRWLSALVLVAAFALASLLTMAAVSRRAREFGTLKSLGWRSRRIIAQVMGESIAMGLLGGAVGVGIGFGGAAVITKIAPKLSATLTTSTGQHFFNAGASGPLNSGTVNHTVSVPMTASVSPNAILLAVVLAIAGGVIAGAFGSWRIAQLRPAAALARVE